MDTWRWLDYNEQRRFVPDASCPPVILDSSCILSDPSRTPEDVASGYGTIVPNLATAVHYMGGGKYQVVKNGGTTGFDGDAVSAGTITGDIEVIIEYTSSGGVLVGINASDPTLNSTYVGSTMLFIDGANGYLFDRFGNQVGVGHSISGKPYGRLTYTASDDTARIYLSADGATWGSALESVVIGLGTTSFYFDSSIGPSGPAFNVIFRPPPVVVVDNITGSSTLVFAPSATLTGKADVTGSATLVFSPAATITGKGALTGSSTLVFAPSGTVAGRGAVTGTSTLVLSPSGTISGRGAIGGASSLTFAPTGALAGVGGISGASPVTFAGSGSLSNVGGTITLIDGAAAITFSNAGNVAGIRAVTGSTEFRLSLSAHLTTASVWADEPDQSGAWADQPSSGTWTDQPANDATWTDDAAAAGTWTDVPTTGNWS